MKKIFNLLFIIFIMILSINNVSAKRELVIGTEYEINVKVIDEDNNLVRNTLLCLYDYKYLQMECFKTNYYGKTIFNALSGKYFIRQETVEGDYIKIDRYDLDIQDDMDLVLVNEFIKKEEPIIEQPIIDEPIKEEQPVIEKEPIIDETIKEEPIIEEVPIKEEEPIVEEISVKEEIPIPIKEEIPTIIEDKKESAIGINNKNITKSINNSKKSVKAPKNSQKIEDNTLLAMNIGVDSDNKGALVYSESKENDKSVDNSQVIFYAIFITLLIILVGIIINKIRVKNRQKV